MKPGWSGSSIGAKSNGELMARLAGVLHLARYGRLAGGSTADASGGSVSRAALPSKNEFGSTITPGIKADGVPVPSLATRTQDIHHLAATIGPQLDLHTWLIDYPGRPAG
jgi:hypothetical protein